MHLNTCILFLWLQIYVHVYIKHIYTCVCVFIYIYILTKNNACRITVYQIKLTTCFQCSISMHRNETCCWSTQNLGIQTLICNERVNWIFAAFWAMAHQRIWTYTAPNAKKKMCSHFCFAMKMKPWCSPKKNVVNVFV